MSRDPVIHEPSAAERTSTGQENMPCDACGNIGRPKETLKRDNVVVVTCIHYTLCIGEATAKGMWKGDTR